MSEAAGMIIAVDSLVANEFEVEIDGEKLLGVFRVSGLTPFRIEVQSAETAHRIHEPFQLVKMVQRDGNSPFNKWLRESVATKSGPRPRRTVSVVAIDDGQETRRWTLRGAYITQVSYSSFDTASSEMVQEIITLHYDEVEETWPATPNLS
jgi:phage tail-like protein